MTDFIRQTIVLRILHRLNCLNDYSNLPLFQHLHLLLLYYIIDLLPFPLSVFFHIIPLLKAASMWAVLLCFQVETLDNGSNSPGPPRLCVTTDQ